MATSRRDVTLGIEVETTGEEGLRSLGKDVRTLAAEGNLAAPAYQRLAEELDRLASQAKALDTFGKLAADTAALSEAQRAAATTASRLAVEYTEQTEAVRRLESAESAARAVYLASKEALSGLTQQLKLDKIESDAAGKSKQDFTAAQKANLRSIVEGKDALEAHKSTLSAASAEVTKAAGFERQLASEYTRAASAAGAATESFVSISTATRAAGGAAEKLGVDLTNLSAAEARIAASTQGAVSEIRALGGPRLERADL